MEEIAHLVEARDRDPEAVVVVEVVGGEDPSQTTGAVTATSTRNQPSADTGGSGAIRSAIRYETVYATASDRQVADRQHARPAPPQSVLPRRRRRRANCRIHSSCSSSPVPPVPQRRAHPAVLHTLGASARGSKTRIEKPTKRPTAPYALPERLGAAACSGGYPTGVCMSCWISLARERAVVDPHLVDQAREPLTPDRRCRRSATPRSTPPSSRMNGVEPACTPFTNSRTTVPSNVTARCVHAFSGNAADPTRVPLAADVHLPERHGAALIAVQPVHHSARPLLDHHRAPATEPASAAPTPPRHPRRQVQRRRIRHRHPAVHPVEAQRRSELPGRSPRRPRDRARIAAARRVGSPSIPSLRVNPYAPTRPRRRWRLRGTVAVSSATER